MDIKKKYFDLIKKRIDVAYTDQKDKIKEVAKMFGDCMSSGGVVQLFGVNHGEEFVNELNYRAGGIAPFHGLKPKDLILKSLIKQEDVDSGKFYSDVNNIKKFAEVYKLDDRDLYCLVSFYGNEPLIIELAKLAKSKGQKVVAVVNKKSYDKHNGKLLDYADIYLDMCADEPDVAMDINGTKVGQLSSTTTNVIAQMITAEVYNYYVSNGKDAPVLLSANVKDADKHNNSLTDPYEGRVR